MHSQIRCLCTFEEPSWSLAFPFLTVSTTATPSPRDLPESVGCLSTLKTNHMHIWGFFHYSLCKSGANICASDDWTMLRLGQGSRGLIAQPSHWKLPKTFPSPPSSHRLPLLPPGMTTGQEHLPAWRVRHANIQASIFTLLAFKAKALNLCLWSKEPKVLHPQVTILAVRSRVTAELGLLLPAPLTSPSAAELNLPPRC